MRAIANRFSARLEIVGFSIHTVLLDSYNRQNLMMLYPVILCGGTGTRLWPLSRALCPKQLLRIISDHTMVQVTANRVRNPTRFHSPLLVCNIEHRFQIAEQLREIEIDPLGIVLEPERRNTAPAVAAAALMLQQIDSNAIIVVLPSDHIVTDAQGFRNAVEAAAEVARSGALVTFGMRPTKAEAGYGYIQCGLEIPVVENAYQVERFVEKPTVATAEAMLSNGTWLWNSGMFVFSAHAFLLELENYCPDVVAACREAVKNGVEDQDFFRLEAGAFSASPVESIDCGVMERTRAAAVIKADIGWSDLGSWSTLWEIAEKNTDGNFLSGDVAVQDVRNCYIRSEAGLLAAVGIEDLIVVSTADAVLISAKPNAQDVKRIVDKLRSEGRQELNHHVRVYRPWGHYQSLGTGDEFQVKKLSVKPGAKLSLQSHAHRAEHWIVVDGTARVTKGENVFDLDVNQTTFIPVGTRHRLENPSDQELVVIEVQSGTYLGEDDIVRFEDVYNRVVE